MTTTTTTPSPSSGMTTSIGASLVAGNASDAVEDVIIHYCRPYTVLAAVCAVIFSVVGIAGEFSRSFPIVAKQGLLMSFVEVAFRVVSEPRGSRDQ